MKGGRRQGRQRKRWEDNIREWTGLEFGKSQRAVENMEKMEKIGCKIICAAPTTLAVKGLMMMVVMMIGIPVSTDDQPSNRILAGLRPSRLVLVGDVCLAETRLLNYSDVLFHA